MTKRSQKQWRKLAKKVRKAITFDRVVAVLGVLVPLAVALIERQPVELPEE